MKRICKLAGVVSKPLQKRYARMNADEREALREVIERESRWMIDKMAKKGYRLEAVVAGVYGLFTRGPAVGSIEMVDGSLEKPGEPRTS